MNYILLIGALLGLSSVMMGAYIDHSLALYLMGKSLKKVLTALRYHQLYSLVICMIGMMLPLQINQRIKSWLIRASYLFIVGVLLFSFSMYVSAIFNIENITHLTPMGGILLMVGWGCLVRTALIRQK